MRPILATATAALASIACLAGCALDDNLDDDLDYASSEHDVVTQNRLATNKLAANRLATNKLAASTMSSTSLATSSLVTTADGRDVLSYVISCALPAGASAKVTYNGTAYTFPGSIGLAPAWATRTPTVSERRWVTACVLARTNLYGVSVSISMRHDTNPALATTPAERATYPTVEGAFYGDLFAATPVTYACAGRSWTKTAEKALVAPKRACALSPDGVTTECGFSYTGLCGQASACADTIAPHSTCRGGGTTYTETITIYLAPADVQ